MGERKVLNRYYPPGLDPSELPRFGTPKSRQIKFRMMLSTSIRCNARGNYIYKGTKFNSRKEVVINEMYLGVQIFRFYFKCTKCSAELTIKSDLQNLDYVVELGAMRNFEPWRKQDEVVENEKRRREAEEMGNAMKSLENKTHDSKREMDILAGLDDFESMKSRHATVDVDATKEKKLVEKDEVLLKSIVFHTSKDFVCRIEDEDSKEEKDLTQPSTLYDESMSNTLKKRKLSEKYSDKPIDLLTTATSSVPIGVVKKVAPSVTIGLQANFSKLWKCKSDHQSSSNTSKVQGMVLPRNLQQLESKQGQSGQIQSAISGSLIKSLTVLDEFKHGFPSNGLSVASNKWWGSGSPGDFEYINATETGRECRPKSDDVADDGSNAEKKAEGEQENSNSTLQGASLLTAMRKRALEEGREALKLGVFMSHRAHKIGKKEKSLMRNIFQSSLPKGWIDA